MWSSNPLVNAGRVSIYTQRTIVPIIHLDNMRFGHFMGLVSNSAANSAAGPVSAPRIPLPTASPNCRQQSDLSLIITLRGRFSGRSEAFLPASRESWPFLREELIGEQTDRCGRPSRHGRH